MPLSKWHTFLMAPCLIYCFIVILLYIERKWVLMRNLATILSLKSKLCGKFYSFNAIDGRAEMLKKMNFQKFKWKWKILKHFARPKQGTALFNSQPDKSCLCVWNKHFLTEIYRNIQVFDFQELWGYSFWAFRNGAV